MSHGGVRHRVDPSPFWLTDKLNPDKSIGLRLKEQGSSPEKIRSHLLRRSEAPLSAASSVLPCRRLIKHAVLTRTWCWVRLYNNHWLRFTDTNPGVSTIISVIIAILRSAGSTIIAIIISAKVPGRAITIIDYLAFAAWGTTSPLTRAPE